MTKENIMLIESKKPVELIQELKDYKIKKTPLSPVAQSKVIRKWGSDYVSEDRESYGSCIINGQLNYDNCHCSSEELDRQLKIIRNKRELEALEREKREQRRKELEQALEELQKKIAEGANELEANKIELATKQKELEDLRNQFNREKIALEQLVGELDGETQQQIQQLQAEKNSLEGEKRILESLLDEKEVEYQEISNQLEEKDKELQETSTGSSQESLQKEKISKTSEPFKIRGQDKELESPKEFYQYYLYENKLEKIDDFEKITRKLHQQLHDENVSQHQKSIIITVILLALAEEDFRRTYQNISSEETLASSLIDSMVRVLKADQLPIKTIETIKNNSLFLLNHPIAKKNFPILPSPDHKNYPKKVQNRISLPSNFLYFSLFSLSND